MKRIVYLLLAIGLFLTTQCSKDDDSGTAYEFVDQDLQGQIGGASWIYMSGTASTWNEDELWIDIYAVESDDPCNEWLDGDRVLFTIPREVGVYTLSFGSEDSHTVTLLDI